MPARLTFPALSLLLVLAFSVGVASGHGRPLTQPQAAAIAASTTSTPAQSTAMRTHRFRGTVTSMRAGHWFRMHTTTGRRVRIYTSSGTRWDGCDWDDMHPGFRIAVRAYRSHGHWTASHMRGWHGQWDDDWDMMP